MQQTSQNNSNDIEAPNHDADIAVESALRKTARHISKRTTDLIAIAIVSIGVLSVSGRLTEWWQTDSASVASPVVSANQTAGLPVQWGAGESAVSLLAGEHPVSMERRVVYGDQDRVDGILRNRLVKVLETEFSTAEPRPDSDLAAGFAEQVDTKFAEQEQRLIEMLQNLTPFATRKDQWNLYRLDDADNPMPGSFLIATRISTDRTKTESLAAWAIATPSGPEKWTSFLLTPANADRTKNRHVTPIPFDGQLLISLSADTHDELTVFQRFDASPTDVRKWADDLSSRLLAAGWQQSRAWQQSETSTAARFEERTTQQHRAMELSISLSETGKLTGTSNVIAIPKMELVPTETTPR